MSFPVIEIPVGSINGVNRTFRVSSDYRPGTTQVWLNGLMHRREGQDGWSELGGNKVQLHEAPRSGDVVQIYFLPI